MNIVYISEFDLVGSGYYTISSTLCTRLANLGHKVTVLGIGYKREEHTYPFTLIPVAKKDFYNQLRVMVHNLLVDEGWCDIVFTALDIPVQLRLMRELAKDDPPFMGLFPLEAPPLCMDWAMQLLKMEQRFVMSQFGRKALMAAGVESIFMPVSVDPIFKAAPSPDLRAKTRAALDIPSDAKVIITVAENQERKNLGAALEITSLVAKDANVRHIMMTSLEGRSGWNLKDLAVEYGIFDNMVFFEKGIEKAQLKLLYNAADIYLSTSKAEGLGLPVLESMASGTPVVAPRHTSHEEHLADGRGYLFDCGFEYRDPFGNERRYFADVSKGRDAVLAAFDAPTSVPELARNYVLARTPELMAEVVHNVL